MAGSGNTQGAAIQALQQLDLPLWIVTAATSEGRGGLAATWVFSASIDPEQPLLMTSLGIRSHTTQLVEHAGAFAAHLLSREQADLAWNFCRDSGRDRDKLEEVPLADASSPPVLRDALASYRCRVVGRLVSGDRVLYWAAVEQGETAVAAQELNDRLLTAGEFFRQLSAAQRQLLGEHLQADIASGRPLRQAWLANLPRELRPETGGRDRG